VAVVDISEQGHHSNHHQVVQDLVNMGNLTPIGLRPSPNEAPASDDDGRWEAWTLCHQ
jgi:hypothetical protein